MRSSNVALRLQESLLKEARRIAEAAGVALNQFIHVVAAEKLSALRTETLFRGRIERADVEKRSASWRRPVAVDLRFRTTRK